MNVDDHYDGTVYVLRGASGYLRRLRRCFFGQGGALVVFSLSCWGSLSPS
ncbi:hypothetical protein ACLK1Y_18835 [Escherichia coli]